MLKATMVITTIGVLLLILYVTLFTMVNWENQRQMRRLKELLKGYAVISSFIIGMIVLGVGEFMLDDFKSFLAGIILYDLIMWAFVGYLFLFKFIRKLIKN